MSSIAVLPSPDDPPRKPGGAAAPRREVGQGAYAISARAGVEMTATLGSCVAVLLTDPLRQIGGMTHIFQCVTPGPLGGANVVAEVETLVNALMHAGVPRRALQAQLIGGARTLGRGRNVGGAIAQVCEDYLTRETIPITFRDLGGTRPRRLTFNPTTGLVDVVNPGTALAHGAPMPRRGGETELF